MILLKISRNCLRYHTKRVISQLCRIKKIKEIIAENNNSLCIRVDWSENANLFQARQEKGSYYHNIQVSVNAIVAYQLSGVSSQGTISDAKSHKAWAVWASLEKFLDLFNLEQLKYLYVISDSPASQYHKCNAFFTKRFAVENNIDVNWLFTESGYGKGPMGGAGASIKNDIDDAIAFHPNSVISCVSDLMPLLSVGDKHLSIYTEKDIKRHQGLLHSDLDIVKSRKRIGISCIHEIRFTPEDNNQIDWKAISADVAFISVQFKSKSLNNGPSVSSISGENTDDLEKDIGILFL